MGISKASMEASAVTPGTSAADPDPQLALVYAYLKHLRLPAIARECVPLAREAEQQGVGYVS
jgi:hypothetical protein